MRTATEVLPESLLHTIVNGMVRLVQAAGALVIVVGRPAGATAVIAIRTLALAGLGALGRAGTGSGRGGRDAAR